MSSRPSGNTGVSVHALAPAVGSVEVTMSPLALIATHSAVDGQEIAVSPRSGEMGPLALHAALPPPGLVLKRTPYKDSAPTHSDVE
jgi:hypothetical protein